MNMFRKLIIESSPLIVVMAMVAFATIRIIDSYQYVSQTHDEPYHILRGVHWHSGHFYLHSEHPPLAPIVIAAIPSLKSIQVSDTDNKLVDGNSILYGNGDYKTTLGRFRIGNLLFFWLTCSMLYAWLTHNELRWSGVAAVFFFSFSPIVIAHAGLATTDFAITAAVLFFVIALRYTLERPTILRWAISGLACGLALSAKYSAFLFLPVSFVVLLLVPLRGEKKERGWSILQFFTFLISSVLVVWTVYRFSFGRLDSIQVRHFSFGGFPKWLGMLFVPAPEFVAGFLTAHHIVNVGHGDYFFGKMPRGGALLFFPVVLALKTPIPIIVATCVGVYHVVFEIRKHTIGLISLAIASAMLFSVMPTTVNIGIRHVLPIIPFMSIVAAIGLMNTVLCVRKRHKWHPYFAMPLFFCFWLVIESCLAHPHTISYFNCMAGGKPENIVINSDLDWGQGIFELQHACKRLGIESLKTAYFGTAELTMHSLPPPPAADCREYWLAVSVTKLYRDDSLSEYRNRFPDATVAGGSIRLYKVRM